MSEAYGFASERDVERVGDATRNVERNRSDRDLATKVPLGGTSPVVRIVKVTGTISGGLYPAQIQSRTAAGVWSDIEECRLRLDDADGETESGDRWLAILTDMVAATGMGIFDAIFAAGGTGEVGRWCRITGEEDDGTWPAVLLDIVDGEREDGDEIIVKLIPGSGQEFVEDGIYWVTLLVEGEGEDPDIYDGKGNDFWIHPACNDGMDQFNLLSLPHPIRHATNVDEDTGEPL